MGSRILLFGGVHAFSACVPSILFPNLGYSLLLTSTYADRCMEGDLLCGFMFYLTMVLVFGYAVGYTIAGLYVNQGAAITAGIVGKLLVAWVLWRGYASGVFSTLALVVGFSDFLLALAYIYVMVTPNKKPRSK
jgi:hypothetical protein